jgi:hypothetical protein
MLKSSQISSVLSEAARNLSQQLNLRNHDGYDELIISFTSADGNLLAASVKSDSVTYGMCQRIAAVAASIALEYIAIEKLGASEFRTLQFTTDSRIVRCCRIFKVESLGSLFLVSSLPFAGELDELGIHALLRAVSDRIEEDLMPSMSPVLANMVHSTPLE